MQPSIAESSQPCFISRLLCEHARVGQRYSFIFLLKWNQSLSLSLKQKTENRFLGCFLGLLFSRSSKNMSQLIWTAGKWRHALGSLTWRKREKKGQKENRNYESQIVVIRNLTLCKWKNSRKRRCPWLFCVSTVSRTASGVTIRG